MHNRVLRYLAVFMLALLYATPAPAFAQEAAPSVPAGGQAATGLAGDFRKDVLSTWAGVKQSLESKDYEGAKAGLRELEGLCMDHGITSYEALSAAMVKQGKALAESKEVGGALLLYESAISISPDYPPPYFAKGWAYLVQDKMKVLMTLDAFLEGFRKSAGDFWWTFLYTGNKTTSVLFTLAALFSLFGLFMAVRYTPLLAHDVSEFMKKPALEEKLVILILPLIFLAVLVALGYWWAASLAFLSLWVYFNKKEKGLALTFFVLLVFMPEVMSGYSHFAQAGGKRLLWVMDEVNKGPAGQGTEEYLKALLEDEPGNEQARTSLAQAFKKAGRYQEAADTYSKLIEARPSSAMYHNNLGNIYFITGRNGDAIKEYNSAILGEPGRVVPYFNLSQVYGESLMFAERERADLTGRQLNPAAVASMRNRAGSTPIRMVFDEQVPSQTFWHIAFSDNSGAGFAESLWMMTVRVLPLHGTRLAGVSFIVLAFAVDAFRRKRVYAHFCQKCGKVSCRKCQKPHYSKELCPECHQVFVKLEGVEARDRVRKLLDTREKQRKKGLFLRITSLL
ncbi:MAG TPA: tetratricopeptide repeat protein, partial [Nitrospirota bacterium]|nr:tetratricopeptide repeat protein [Nitrospirota bacterium]